MSAIIRELTADADEKQIVYPVTLAKAVYMDNREQTVQEALDDLEDGNSKITFPARNKVVRTLSSGNVTTITFNAGSIDETTVTAEGKEVRKRTTTFNKDGSIDIKIEV